MKRIHISTISALVALPFALVLTSGTHAQNQHPILDQLAAKVIAKYRNASCSDLQAQKAANIPPTPMEQRAIQALRSDPNSRTYFINKIAPPIANKMFDCGMIP